jgi:acetyl esterase/lipase
MDETPSWIARNPAFLPPDRRDLHGSDSVLKWLHSALPLSVQHQLRDSGVLRLLADAGVLATAPFVLGWHPSTILRVLKLNARRRTFAYGHHAHQTVDYYAGDVEQASGSREVDAPAVAFVHGGAWGSGRPWMYQLVADTLLALGYSAVFMSKCFISFIFVLFL